MSITSKGRAAAAFLMAGCIQGPWDYKVEEQPVFRGIFSTAYIIAGERVKDVCFEKILKLDEEHTSAFPFYDSAEVRIRGLFNGVDTLVVLQPKADTPNCFTGDPGSLPEAGVTYELEAFFVWDSSGTKTSSRLTGATSIPAAFAVGDSAHAPRLALTGATPQNIFDPAFLRTLPPDVQEVLFAEFGDTLTQMLGDSAALEAYFQSNGARIQKRILGLLQKDSFAYGQGDTLFYLTGAFNTLSHQFPTSWSADVGGVLITHRFDPGAMRPETRFDNLFGHPSDTGEYYYPGDLRRLQWIPYASNGPGRNVLDTIPVINLYFHTGLNRLYFHAFDDVYNDFVFTAIEGESDPKSKKKYNIRGGLGIFAGAIKDSFDFFIRVDSLTPAYPLQRARAKTCEDEGWFGSRDCREYYLPHCAEVGWDPQYCGPAAIYAALEAGAPWDSLLDSISLPAVDEQSLRLTREAYRRSAEAKFCPEQAFPPSLPACAAQRDSCLVLDGPNACKESLWTYCLDRQWRPAQCGPALVTYCRDKPRKSEVLCRNADAYCVAHPGEAPCR